MRGGSGRPADLRATQDVLAELKPALQQCRVTPAFGNGFGRPAGLQPTTTICPSLLRTVETPGTPRAASHSVSARLLL